VKIQKWLLCHRVQVIWRQMRVNLQLATPKSGLVLF